MEKLRLLVTGANGLLGKHTLEAFSKQYEVHAMVREVPAEPISGVTYYALDLKKDWSTEGLPQGIHTIFHLAQSELFRDFPSHALDVYHVNVTSTVKLLDFAQRTGVKKFVFTSTGGIYDTSLEAVSENSPINTFGLLGNYFATKLCSEILTHNYTQYFDVTLLRLFFMYGKGQRRSMLIPRLVDNVKYGRPIKLSANGGIQINPVHVSDVVQLLNKLINASGSFTYNVAGPEVLTIKQIADTIASQLNITPIYEFSDTVGDNWIANIDLLTERIYQPKVKLGDKISELF